MSYADKELTCSNCGSSFTFTADEQALFATRGYTNEPKRCPVCRAARKAENDGLRGYNRPRRRMYPAVCAQCGKETEVPFEPRQGRAVYCSSCYDRVRSSSRY